MAEGDTGTNTSVVRPLSPHLGIYRLTLTMAMSILHRITGAALYVGTLILVVWLVALSTDAGAYIRVARILGSFLGKLVLFGYTWALFHHMFGGIRHFIWDTGHALDDPARERIAQANLAGSLLLTIVVWAIYVFVA